MKCQQLMAGSGWPVPFQARSASASASSPLLASVHKEPSKGLLMCIMDVWLDPVCLLKHLLLPVHSDLLFLLKICCLPKVILDLFLFIR